MLTAPDGNAWLARGLERGITSRAAGRIVNNALAIASNRPGRAVRSTSSSRAKGAACAYEAGTADLGGTALPRAARLRRRAPAGGRGRRYSHAPWLVANLNPYPPAVRRRGAACLGQRALRQSRAWVTSFHAPADASGRCRRVLTYYRALRMCRHRRP